ncbi:MAG: vitamin B12 dependent-methionine synthase activation domain-containing protein [Bacteroidota bacterium]
MSPVVLPKYTGIILFNDHPVEEIRKFINWTSFFRCWGIPGRIPALFEHPRKGKEAKKLFDDAGAMLHRIHSEKLLTARGVAGIFPANAVGNDVEVYSPDGKGKVQAVFHFLRNQEKKPEGEPNLCLADYIPQKDTGITGYIGCFALTTGIGVGKSKPDEYDSIMMKMLADRLAEAFSELMHFKIRTEFWAYEKTNVPDLPSILKGNYPGIRPAPGYPACPDHTEKKIIFELLDAEDNTGIRLTENFAMDPASSICGYYFAGSNVKYFSVGRILEDQLENYASRKKISKEMVKKFLASNLNYE